MTLAYTALWALAVAAMAAGWVATSLIVAGVAALLGARHWLAARTRPKPRVYRVYQP